ncbi:MAG: molybdopterin-synthase adenylyltransferase MoeB [Bacteroidota bacterium]
MNQQLHMEELTKEEKERYSRQIILPELGLEGQEKLKQAKVLVIGAGGLGSPLIMYLAAAGVGTIGIVDDDVVDRSNLQRQVLYGEELIGQSKAEQAEKRVASLNPHVKVILHQERINSENALDIIKEYDLVADGADNFPTRYLSNDACYFLDKPLVYASIYRFEGQVSVFNLPLSNGERSPNYRDLYPSPPPPELVPSCAEGGVLGVVAGVMGSLQALEVLKVITGMGQPLVGKVLIWDGLQMISRKISFSPLANNPISGKQPTQKKLIDYVQFCAGPQPTSSKKTEVKEIEVKDMMKWKEESVDFQLIDVRKKGEYEMVNIEGEWMEDSKIDSLVKNISRDKAVIVHCKSGSRSRKVIQKLEIKYGFTNLYNLKGGILAYIEEIDPSLPTY